jgi:uncharacterized protein (TIGR02646 family)
VIRVNRGPEPVVVRRHAHAWLADLQAALKDLNRVTSDPKATAQAKKRAKDKVNKAQGKYNHPKIKQALLDMFCEKCAYCESPITHVTYGNIEHFYPKAQYADKTFEWENMLLACDICNNARHKGSKFPLDAQGRPLLIDPTDGVTDPVTHLIFSWNPLAGLAAIYGRDRRGQIVEQTFDFSGLRGRKALIKERSEYVKKLMVLLKYAQDGNAEALDILKEACQPDAPYAAFALTHIAPHINH